MNFSLAPLALAGTLVASQAGAAFASAKIVCFGDSLTQGFGVAARDSYPAVLERSLRSSHYDVTVVNAGISGETTSDGVGRLSRVLALDPQILIVAFGANDALRGYPVAAAKANLRKIIKAAQTRHIEVMLAGLTPPPMLASPYFQQYVDMYQSLAHQLKVPLVPSLLDGVMLVPSLNIGDGVHPNAAGYQRVVRTLLPYLQRRLIMRPNEAVAR